MFQRQTMSQLIQQHWEEERSDDGEKPLRDQAETAQSFRQTQGLEAHCREHGQN
jgi:hypothetical protein